MTQTVGQPKAFHIDLNQVNDWAPPKGDVLAPKRNDAMTRFTQLGCPTPKHEAWRYTNVKPIAQAALPLATPSKAEVTAEMLERYRFKGLNGPRVVFIDGFYSSDFSTLTPTDGLTVTSLNEAHTDLLEDHLTRYADFQDDAFTALNTALFEQGACVHVAKNAVIDEPVEVLHVATGPAVAKHIRNLIVAEDNSRAAIIERHVSLDFEESSWTNTVTEIVIGANAQLSHYDLKLQSERAYNIAQIRVHQQRDSRYLANAFLIGGHITRNNIHMTLGGPGCDSRLDGLFLPRGEQTIDTHIRVVHAAEHCDSRQFYKGILDDSARGVFEGRIIVNEGAQKTDAVQSNRNLLLSDKAQTNTMPQLEIYADDVKCTHGCTTGQIDEQQLFYLMARGIDEETARGLLIHAFATEALEHMTL
ncbi:MAG: Fe-S cluster assembly protein SufD, partial [Planctomycetota bacterium]